MIKELKIWAALQIITSYNIDVWVIQIRQIEFIVKNSQNWVKVILIVKHTTDNLVS